jgi:hypothetical protein
LSLSKGFVACHSVSLLFGFRRLDGCASLLSGQSLCYLLNWACVNFVVSDSKLVTSVGIIIVIKIKELRKTCLLFISRISSFVMGRFGCMYLASCSVNL